MVTKSALLASLAMLAEFSAVLLAAAQLRPLPVLLALAALSVVGARLMSSAVVSGDPVRVVAAGLLIVPGFLSGILGALLAVVPVGALAQDTARVAVGERLARLVPSSFPVGGNRVEQRDVVDVTTRRNPGQESVPEVAGACARALGPPGRQP